VSRRTKIIIAVVVLVVVGGVVAALALRSGGSGPQISTAKVEQTDLGVTVAASGKVTAGSRADVYPPTAGTLDEVYVKDGQAVKAGDKLAMMDTGPLELNLEQAKSGLAAANAAYENIGATSVSSADIAAARANVVAAKAALDAAKLAAANVKSSAPTPGQLAAAQAGVNAAQIAYNNATAAYNAALIEYGSTSPTTAVAAQNQAAAYAAYLNAQNQYAALAATNLKPAQAQANAGVAQANAAYKAAIASLKKAQAADPGAQKSAAQAAVNAAGQAVDVAQAALDDATLVAPMDGTVFFNASGLAQTDGKLPVASAGSAVSPASAPFSIVNLQGCTFTAEVDEADIDRVKLGMAASVTLDAFPGQSFKTSVTRINSASQPTATGGTIFPVDLSLTGVDKNILIGMKGDSTVEVSSIKSALTIPVEALFNENGTNFAYKVVNNKLVKTDITVGATTDTEVEVLKGLQAGDVVALSGSTQYTDGMTVRVK
jgi:HlyD family secretion protein